MSEYSKDVFYPYIQDKYQSQGTEAPDTDYYGQYPTRFYTQLVSIEADKIKDYITEKGMDYEGFCQGQYGLIACDNPGLFPSGCHLPQSSAVLRLNPKDIPYLCNFTAILVIDSFKSSIYNKTSKYRYGGKM